MRILSNKKYKIKNKIFGGEEFLLCVPILSINLEDFLQEVKDTINLKPDVIEWRVDYFDNLDCSEGGDLIFAMKHLRNLTHDIPVIFTCRHINEGGSKIIPQKDRINIIEKALNIGLADLVDVEMMIDIQFIDDVKTLTHKYNKELILSYHDFKETPDMEEIIKIINQGKKLGASISKLAVMANSYGDVLNLLNAAYEVRKTNESIPVIAISMGDYGKISRIIGKYFGVDLGFVANKNLSAPGQISLNKLKQIFELIN